MLTMTRQPNYTVAILAKEETASPNSAPALSCPLQVVAAETLSVAAQLDTINLGTSGIVYVTVSSLPRSTLPD